MTNPRPPGSRQAVPTLSPWNPRDHLRLLVWVFVHPARLAAQRQRGDRATHAVGAWLTSTLLWLPILAPMAAVGLGTLPSGGRQAPIWLIGAGIALGWALTGLLAERERGQPGFREQVEAVFGQTFVIVFGLAFGIAFGMALLTAFDLLDIVAVGQVVGPRAVAAFVAAFAGGFGVAFIVGDQVAFGGAFVIMPMLAFAAAFVGVFGLGFVGAFAATFLTVFGMAFIAAFVVVLLTNMIIGRGLERHPNSHLATALRMTALAVLVLSHAALVWVCLLNGWRALG